MVYWMCLYVQLFPLSMQAQTSVLVWDHLAHMLEAPVISADDFNLGKLYTTR
jgi:hypothetical protein